MNPRISMITLGVRDLAGSVKFYEQALLIPQTGQIPDGHPFFGTGCNL